MQLKSTHASTKDQIVANTLAGVEKKHVLVFYDYHLISKKDVKTLMIELIDNTDMRLMTPGG